MEESSNGKEKVASREQFLSKFNKQADQELPENNTATSGKRKHNDDGWGEGRGNYNKIKNVKLKEQNKEFELKSFIFKGISIYVNGYTSPSSDKLKQLICEHGGQYVHFFSKTNVTHVIATNLPDGKIKNLKWNDRVVHPNWIVDSIEKMKLLPEDMYLIFSVAKREGNVIKFSKKVKLVADENTELIAQTTIIEGVETEPDLPKDNSVYRESFCDDIDDEMDQDNDFAIDMDIEPAQMPQLTSHTYTKQNETTKQMLKAGDKNYIEEYYAHSRLHHLSMWKAELKKFTSSIHKKWKGKRVECLNENPKQKYIMHIDLDSFFASVALKLNPELQGKPIAVCHSKGDKPTDSESWSEIASCNYEARNFGLRNGMFLKDAKKRCSELICVPYNFEEYRRVSQQFYEIISKYTCEVQAVSCDEVLLDASKLILSDEDCLQLAENIRSEVYTATQCTASCGIGNSILIAKLATRHAKPDGLHYIRETYNSEFILTQDIKDLPGVGHNTRRKLNTLGIATCADMQKFSQQALQTEFGKKFGKTLHSYARGIDDRKIKTDNEVKSVSAEINYGMRFTKIEEVESFVHDLASEVEKRLKENNTKGRLITLKLMIAKKEAPNPSKYMGHGACDTLSKSCALPYVTNDPKIISGRCIKIIHNLHFAPNDYRGIGIQVSKLLDNSASTTSSSVDLLRFAKPVSQQDLFMETETAHVSANSTSIPKDNLATNREVSSEPQAGSFGDQNEGNWDQSVLDALPKDIRNELLHNRLAAQRKEAQQNAANRNSCEKEKSTASKKSPRCKGKEKKTKNLIKTKFKIDEHLKNQRTLSTGNVSSASNVFSSVPAMNDIKSILPSHIDPVTFDALPDDIKIEILNDAKLKKKYDSLKSKSNVFSKTVKNLVSKSSTAVGQMISSPDIYNQGEKTTIATAEHITIVDDSPPIPQQPIDKIEKIIISPQEEKNKGVLKQHFPELCGVQDPTEIKNVLRRWVHEYEAPLEEDIQGLNVYFNQLLTSYNMESLYSFMLFFRRVLSSRSSWHHAFNVILDSVQREIKVSYHGTFPISPFPIID